MISALREIAKIFADVAEGEEAFLKQTSGGGIFFMPELAYAYACGKAVMVDSNRIFGNVNVAWEREVNLGLGGPSNLVFKLPSNYRIVVEFKMRDTLAGYVKEIRKLNRLTDSQTAGIFCVLADPFSDETSDKRVAQVEAEAGCKMTPLLHPFPRFPTKQDRYSGEISCLVAAWSVGTTPPWPVRAGARSIPAAASLEFSS